MSQKFVNLKTLLMELFQLNQPELDFGLYRVMAARRDEISQFLERDLLPQVQQAFAVYQSADKADLQKDLQRAIAQADALGADPETMPKVKDLRAKLQHDAVDVNALEAEVYDHLYTFFRRYYSEGDFLAKRVYKAGTYAIPYEGEEVMLHWANKDQYYIKSSEYLRDYTFRLRPDDAEKPMRVHFRLVDVAEGEHGNVKAAEGKERRFKLTSVTLEAGELVAAFTYQPDLAKQKELNLQAETTILTETDPAFRPWQTLLGRVESERTVLAKHLDGYTKRNTMDYFIHKDLGTFLRRELDFFIKNEVMHLDDVELETAPRVEQYLSKIRVMRKIAGKIITFLAQLEDFQKKLWLKKKFVVQTQYCVTLGQIPEALYPEIAANQAQHDEWKKLFAIQEIEGDLATPGYTPTLTPAFLHAHPTLVVDTRHFPADFTERLLQALGDLDEVTDGVLFHSENFDAATLCGATFAGKISCFYADPPFNLGVNGDFLYRTDYVDSSWLSLLENRLDLSKRLFTDDCLIFVRCDYHGSHRVRDLLESMGLVFKAEILLDRSRNEAGSPNKMESTYEHLFMFGLNDSGIRKFTVERSLANIKWTGFLMAGDRNPPERRFLGQTLRPPAGQHFSLRQEKVDKLLALFFLRVKCKACGAIYFQAADDLDLERQMKSKENKFKFYDIKAGTAFHGTRTLVQCVDCSRTEFRVEYLGSDEVFVNDNWLDIPSYSRRWGFSTENAEELLERVVEFSAGPVMDLFGGSGTTAAVAMKKGRRWVTSEIGAHFDDVLLPRLKRVLGGEQSGISTKLRWKGGRAFKYLRLESYEDTLNNLELRRTPAQTELLNLANPLPPDGFSEQYLLQYALDVETRGSLLDLRAFADPLAYRLTVKKPGSDESQRSTVDLLETFNWLLGLKVHALDAPVIFAAEFMRDNEGRLVLKSPLRRDAAGPFWFRKVEGRMPDGRRTVIVWRKLTGRMEEDNLVLDTWLTHKLKLNTRDSEFDLIYVNGGNNLENLKNPDETWKVRLIEEDFQRLMFAEVG